MLALKQCGNCTKYKNINSFPEWRPPFCIECARLERNFSRNKTKSTFISVMEKLGKKSMKRNGHIPCRVENCWGVTTSKNIGCARHARVKDLATNGVTNLDGTKVTIEQLEQREQANNYICETPSCTNAIVVVDHKHVTPLRTLNTGQQLYTGPIRFLLCNSCNIAIGHAKESSNRLRELADMIDEFDKAYKPA